MGGGRRAWLPTRGFCRHRPCGRPCGGAFPAPPLVPGPRRRRYRSPWVERRGPSGSIAARPCSPPFARGPAGDGTVAARAGVRVTGQEKGRDRLIQEGTVSPWSRGPEVIGSGRANDRGGRLPYRESAAGYGVASSTSVLGRTAHDRTGPYLTARSDSTMRCLRTPDPRCAAEGGRWMPPRAGRAQPSSADSAGSQMLNAAPRSGTAGSRTRSPSIARHSSRDT